MHPVTNLILHHRDTLLRYILFGLGGLTVISLIISFSTVDACYTDPCLDEETNNSNDADLWKTNNAMAWALVMCNFMIITWSSLGLWWFFYENGNVSCLSEFRGGIYVGWGGMIIWVTFFQMSEWWSTASMLSDISIPSYLGKDVKMNTELEGTIRSLVVFLWLLMILQAIVIGILLIEKDSLLMPSVITKKTKRKERKEKKRKKNMTGFGGYNDQYIYSGSTGLGGRVKSDIPYENIEMTDNIDSDDDDDNNINNLEG